MFQEAHSDEGVSPPSARLPGSSLRPLLPGRSLPSAQPLDLELDQSSSDRLGPPCLHLGLSGWDTLQVLVTSDHITYLSIYWFWFLIDFFRPDNSAMNDLMFSLTGVPISGTKLWCHAFYNCVVLIIAMANVFVEYVIM